jgi:hypothetical protein
MRKWRVRPGDLLAGTAIVFGTVSLILGLIESKQKVGSVLIVVGIGLAALGVYVLANPPEDPAT